MVLLLGPSSGVVSGFVRRCGQRLYVFLSAVVLPRCVVSPARFPSRAVRCAAKSAPQGAFFLQDDVDFRRGRRQVIARCRRADADAAAGNGCRDPLEEFGEGAGVHGVERGDGIGQLPQVGGVCLRPGGAGDDVAKTQRFDDGDDFAVREQVGRFAVGEDDEDGAPVAFLSAAAGDAVALDGMGDVFQRCAEEGRAALRADDFRQYDLFERGQRQHVFNLRVEGGDGEIDTFQRVGVLPQRGEQGVQAGVDGFDGFAAHGAGGVDADVGEQASGHGLFPVGLLSRAGSVSAGR